MTTETEFLDPAGVAALLGVDVATVYTYKNRGTLPDPDGPKFGNTETWRRETIAAFKAARPGRGKGGGRKPKVSSDA